MAQDTQKISFFIEAYSKNFKNIIFVAMGAEIVAEMSPYVPVLNNIFALYNAQTNVFFCKFLPEKILVYS